MTVQLHLGCWNRFLPNFIHIDVADFPHIDYKQDIKHLPQFNDNTVSLIYCSHALEYFDRGEALYALREWYRVLTDGGTLRLAVPDFEAIVKVYQKYGSLEHRGILGPLYGRMEVKVGDKTKIFYHKTVYDFKALKKLLELVGFKHVRRYNWKTTIHKDYDDFSRSYIPHLNFGHGILISLNVEATK